MTTEVLDNNERKATHQGQLPIGDVTLQCAVLEDGTRIISRNAIFRAFKRTKRGRAKDETRVANMPSFIDAKNLQEFISDDLRPLLTPINYTNTRNREVTGYNAEVLPLLCDVYLQARTEKKLTTQQQPLAQAAEIIVRSLSKIGIIALIDEATGYQTVRARNELQQILSVYIAKELLPWTKRFPDEFYKEMFRLRGWAFDPLSVKRPLLVGKLTEDIVYKRLPPGVLDELKTKNPKNDKGYRKFKHHQFLTEDIGNPHLEKHIASVVTLMRISPNWRRFKGNLTRAFPLPNEQIDLFDDEEDE